MILILIALIAVVWLSVWGANKQGSFLSEVVCTITGLAGFTGLLIYSILGWEYLAAEEKANIINREYGTNYTQKEVFYASDVIDNIRHLDRKRIELNGDLINGKQKR